MGTSVAFSPLAITSMVILMATNIIALVLNAFFKGYGQKKGENLATKEDIEKLTRVQEEIKTELSEKTWSKQRHWELKRDTALEVMRVFGELQQLVNTLFHELKPEKNVSPDIKGIFEVKGQAAAMDEAQKQNDERKRILNEYLLTMRKFWQARGMVGMVFSEDISNLMSEVQNALAHLVALLSQRDPPFTESEKNSRMNNLGTKKNLVTEALRNELKI